MLLNGLNLGANVQPLRNNSPAQGQQSANFFLQKSDQSNQFGVNQNNPNGFYAGQHNGKDNVVGRQLFVLA